MALRYTLKVYTNHINNEKHVDHGFLAPWPYLCSTSLKDHGIMNIKPYSIERCYPPNGIEKSCHKGIWYGSEPVVISLQLTNFQSLIGLRMHRIVFREDPKSHKTELKCHDTCLSCLWNITTIPFPLKDN